MQGSITYYIPNYLIQKEEDKMVNVFHQTDDMRLKVKHHIYNNPICEFFTFRGMSLPHSDTKFEVYFRPNPLLNNSIDHLYDVKLKGLYELYGTDKSNQDNVWTGEYNQAYKTWDNFIKYDYKNPSNQLVIEFFDTMGVVPILPGCKDCRDGPNKRQVKSDYNYWRRQWFIHGCLHFEKPIDFFWYQMYLFHWISTYGINLNTIYWNQKPSEYRRGLYYEVITCNVQYSRGRFVRKWRSY